GRTEPPPGPANLSESCKTCTSDPPRGRARSGPVLPNAPGGGGGSQEEADVGRRGATSGRGRPPPGLGTERAQAARCLLAVSLVSASRRRSTCAIRSFRYATSRAA